MLKQRQYIFHTCTFAPVQQPNSCFVLMNWTGGRLHRHSHSKAASLSRIQKQHFAKARLKARNEAYQASPLRFFTSRKPLREFSGQLTSSAAGRSYAIPEDETRRTAKRRRTDDSLHVQQHQSHEKHTPNRRLRSFEGLDRFQHPHEAGSNQHRSSNRQTESHVQSRSQYFTQKDTLHDGPRERPQTSSQLEDLKRQLLRQGDWAAVSASRPLRMTFASVTEREMVGKRRKITEDDQRRQAAPVAKVFSPEFHTTLRRKRQRNEPSETSTLGDISIRINGYRPNSKLRSDSKELMLSQESSESMLLDREEAVYNGNPMGTRKRASSRRANSRIPNCPSITSNTSLDNVVELRHLDHDRLSARFASSVPFSTPSRKLTAGGVINTAHSIYWNSRSPRSKSPGFPSQAQSRSSSLISQTKGPPVRHRFTLDDQVRAEREGRLSISSPRLEAQDIYKRKPKYDGDKTFPGTPKQTQKSSLFFSGNYFGRSIRSARDNEDALTSIQCLSSNQNYRWLPATRHKISRDLASTKNNRSVLRSEDIGSRFEEPTRINITTNDSQRQNASLGSVGNANSSAKFFGQSIQSVTQANNLDSWTGFAPTSEQTRGHGHVNKYQDDIQSQHRYPPSSNKATHARTDNSSLLEEQLLRDTGLTTATAPFSTQPTIQTSANTYLNPKLSQERRTSAQPRSETDFLSHLSPMGGFPDDSLAQISVHNNAPRTIRSPSVFSTMDYLSPVTGQQQKGKHAMFSSRLDNQSNVSSAFFASSTSLGLLFSMQNQPSESPFSERKISSPDPLAMSEPLSSGIEKNVTSRGSIQLGRHDRGGNRNAVFGNIHADEGEQPPIFRTPFRR